MPEITVSPLSSSVPARKVGSSRTKRFSALPRLASIFCSAGAMESEITGSGTCIALIATSVVPSVKVSPEAHSIPKSATMSPEPACSMSSIWFECMRTRRPTLCRFLVRELTMVVPFWRVPW